MRTMFDSVAAYDCPKGAQLYAGYVDGNYQSYLPMVGLFPGAVHVSITVHGNPAHMCDVEFGAMTPMQAAQWVQQRRALGFTPTVYCSLSNVTAVLADCQAIGVKLPVQFAIADWDESPIFPAPPPGAMFVSKQYRHDLHINGFNYDISSVVDYWPGVDDGLDPQGGGTPITGDDMTPAEHQLLQDIHDRLAKIDTMSFAVSNSILPAVADMRPNVDAMAPQVASIAQAVGSLSSGGVDADALAATVVAALNASFPPAVIALMAQKLGA